MKEKLERLLAYATGAVALVVVAAAAGSAITYAVMHGTETLSHLGNSALQGIGMAIGGCLGSALVLRFKVARKYVKGILTKSTRSTLTAARPPEPPMGDDLPDNGDDRPRHVKRAVKPSARSMASSSGAAGSKVVPSPVVCHGEGPRPGP